MKGDVKIGESMSFNSKLISSKNLLITLQKNIIANLGKETEIEFGKYDGFKIYNLNKNEFVTVYDSQNKNLYFLDKNLNIQVPEFADLIPSAENIAIVIYNKLFPHLDNEKTLEIILYETPRNFVKYSG